MIVVPVAVNDTTTMGDLVVLELGDDDSGILVMPRERVAYDDGPSTTPAFCVCWEELGTLWKRDDFSGNSSIS